MNDYISIQDAAAKTGKSIATITRLARQYKNTKYVKKTGKKYLISASLINQIYSLTNHDQSKTNQFDDTIQGKNETIEVLKNQLQTKDDQINRLNDTVDNLTERLRESNILLKNTQVGLPENKIKQAGANQTEHPANEVQTKIIELYQAGYSARETASLLDANGFKNRFGRAFTISAIQKQIQRLKQRNLL